MTLIKYQCDRCGKSRDKIRDVMTVKMTHVASTSPMAEEKTMIKKDLCVDCAAQFTEWMNDFL